MRVLSFSEAHGSTPAVEHPSFPGVFWERDVVTEPVCQVRPIDVLWGEGQDCKVSNQTKSRCSGRRSRDKLERHAAWHYLVEMSACATAQTEPRLKETSKNLDLLPPKPKLSFRYLKQGIEEFHRKYVLAPADKAANNVVIV